MRVTVQEVVACHGACHGACRKSVRVTVQERGTLKQAATVEMPASPSPAPPWFWQAPRQSSGIGPASAAPAAQAGPPSHAGLTGTAVTAATRKLQQSRLGHGCRRARRPAWSPSQVDRCRIIESCSIRTSKPGTRIEELQWPLARATLTPGGTAATLPESRSQRIGGRPGRRCVHIIGV